ncbi:hypothetical protein BGX31_004584, partial [Mortierella sp. GBA43]
MASSPTVADGRPKNTTEAESLADMNVMESVQVSTLVAGGHITTNPISSVASASAPGSQGLSVNIENDSKAVLTLTQVEALSQTEPLGSVSERQIIPSIHPDMQTQLSGSSNMQDWIVQAVQNGQVDRLSKQLVGYMRGVKDEVSRNNELATKNYDLAFTNNDLALKNNELATKNNELITDVKELTLKNMELSTNMTKIQEEMKQMQIQALSQLALLQSRVRALVTQTYELHEYPIPRLFVVLPQDTSSWNPANLLSNKFRLYFLCECGEHTKSINSKIPHHIHIAKHEGYEISRPTEFFKQYGHYVLTILKMLKFGISVAGVAIPAVSYLVRTDALDQATKSLKAL